MRNGPPREHLRPGEEVLWATRPSRWGLVPVTVNALLALAAVLGGFLAVRYVDPTQVAGFGVVALAVAGVLARFGKEVVPILFTTYVATEERFYAVTSFVSTTVRSVPLARLTTMTVRQGIVQSLMGLWTARITAYGEAGTTVDIPAIRDGHGLLREGQTMMRRGASASWLLKGD